MRVRTSIFLVAVLIASIAPFSPALAQDASEDAKTVPCTPVTTAGLPLTVGVGNGFFIAEATVTPPDGGATRTMDACDAAIFVQSWLAEASFGGQDILQDPPADAPVSKVDIKADWNGTVGYLTVYYAEANGKPFIAFNQEQGITPAPADPPPEQAPWFTGLARIVDAFNGDAELIETQGVIDATSTTLAPGATTTEGADPSDGGSDSGSSAPWPWIVAGVAVVVVGGGLVLRRRRT